MNWIQTYNPLGSVALSAAVAALPVIVLLVSLAIFRIRAHLAVAAALISVLAIAIGVYRMPAITAFAAAGFGALYGVLPIGWIVLNVVFLYEITVQTGQFEILKKSIATISSDRRIQALLIAFSFGAFIEGAAGFGAPVAISAAMLMGIGFQPLIAASISLIGNTAPVAFGSLGIPLISLAQVTGLPLLKLSAMVGRQLPVFSLFIPFWLIAAMAGWRAMWEVWPACLVAGASFAAVQFSISNFHGPWLVDTGASLASMICLLGLLRLWQPQQRWLITERIENESFIPGEKISRTALARAWAPWALLAVIVFVWALPTTKSWLNSVGARQFPIPFLHLQVLRAPPLVPVAKPEEAMFAFNLLGATGTAPLLTALIAGLCLGLRPVALARAYGKTIWRLRVSLGTIAGMLALAFASRYAGIDSTLGLAFARTGKLFPFFSPILGWIGVALTGSDTASNVLFGNLQKVTGLQLGVPPILAAAANSTGGVMGKMIDAQSIVVASVATNRPGEAGAILRRVFWHSVALACLAGALVLAQAYWLPAIVP